MNKFFLCIPYSTFLTIGYQMPQQEDSTCNVKLKIPEVQKVKIVHSLT